MSTDEKPPEQKGLDSVISDFLELVNRIMPKHGYKIPGEQVTPAGEDLKPKEIKP